EVAAHIPAHAIGLNRGNLPAHSVQLLKRRLYIGPIDVVLQLETDGMKYHSVSPFNGRGRRAVRENSGNRCAPIPRPAGPGVRTETNSEDRGERVYRSAAARLPVTA